MSTSICQVQQSRPTAAIVENPPVRPLRHDARTLVLLEAPNILVNIAQSSIGLIETYFSLASVIRGTGNMHVPALVTCGGVVGVIPLSPCLIFGWGPFPQLGVAGGGTALLAYYAVGCVVLAAYLRSGRIPVRLNLSNLRLRSDLFADILRVGAVSALVTIGTNVTVASVTGLVGTFGPAAIAGYGVGSRLEYFLVPLVFGLGAPLVALVGTNVGAVQHERAVRVAWIGGLMATAMCAVIGALGAVYPRVWLGVFDSDPAMLAAGSQYLQRVGPFYGFFGLGMGLYFAFQGFGRLRWTVLANFTRLTVAVAGGWLALRSTGDLSALFVTLKCRPGGIRVDQRRGARNGRRDCRKAFA